MFIKICAHTSLENAQLSANAGADAVGFVFAASKRLVTPAQVAAITPHLPAALEKIGVFDSTSADEISRAAETAGLTGIQLHSALNLPLAYTLRRRFGSSMQLIQTLHWELGSTHAEHDLRAGLLALAAERDLFNAVLLDSRLPASAAGGTGRTFDWARVELLLASLAQTGSDAAVTRITSTGEMEELPAAPHHALPHIIVAGGLNADNVAQAIRTLHPFGVDVASGTESAPGKKDPEKIRNFIAAARNTK